MAKRKSGKRNDQLINFAILGGGAFLLYQFMTRPAAAAPIIAPSQTRLTLPTPSQGTSSYAPATYPPTANRSSSLYIKWVQSALNKIIQAGLAVDGIQGPKTTEMIRVYQGIAGIYADGIVGPQTEAVIVQDLQSAPVSSDLWY